MSIKTLEQGFIMYYFCYLLCRLPQMEGIPLSHTKKGKLLAIAGGLIGGPIGLIVSPIVLVVINYFTRKRGTAFRRFIVWAVLGVFLAPVCWILVIAAVLLSAVLHVDNPERTYPEVLDAIEEQFFGNYDNDLQRLRKRYPDKSESWIVCVHGESISGGSRELCDSK